jgi:hypothetical protein
LEIQIFPDTSSLCRARNVAHGFLAIEKDIIPKMTGEEFFHF